MEHKIRPSFGDIVRIRSTPETEGMGLAGKIGTVSGFTAPSATDIEVIGSPFDEHTIAVMFENRSVTDAWFAEELVEFVDHAPGTEIGVGNIKAVRQVDGIWLETNLDGKPLELPASKNRKPWWRFWVRG